MSVAQQQSNTRRMHDTLLHGETLLVVAAGDLEDVAFEFGAEIVAGDFLAHAAVHELAEFAVIVDFDELLGAVCGVGDIELHLDGGGGDTSRWKYGEWVWEVVDFRLERFDVWAWRSAREKASGRSISDRTGDLGISIMVSRRSGSNIMAGTFEFRLLLNRALAF